MPLHHKWTQHLKTESEKTEFRTQIYADELVLKRLYAIIEEYELELETKDLSINEYESPAFPYLKADRNGERRAFSKIKQLLEFLKE